MNLADDHTEFLTATVKIIILAMAGFIFHNYHIIAGNIFVTLSICYLVWKWRMDWKERKERKKMNNQNNIKHG